MYAILDIETTGGQFNEEGITEIAIYKFDGNEIVDQFISLVNPEIPIQPFVIKLTGINNEMLVNAPKFYEVAKRILEICKDCILVAHNSSFDYRILRTEFRRLGYDFQTNTLCTVELAQKLLPEQPSFSLGKLVRALGIPMADRHRASGDALATVKLFKLLLSKDISKTIVKELIKTEVEKGISPKLLDIVEALPSKTGVYYVHRQDGTIIFIAKSKNIKRAVNKHFIGESRISKKIQAEVFTVTFEETATELIGIIKERTEVLANKPELNKISNKSIYRWGLYEELDDSGYRILNIKKADRFRKEISLFATLPEAKNMIEMAIEDYYIIPKLLKIGFELDVKSNNTIPTVEIYNQRIEDFVNHVKIERKTFFIRERGRTIHERSAILVEDGICKGYAFFDLNYQVLNVDVLKNILVPIEHTSDIKNILQAYILKNTNLKIVYL